MTPIDTDAFNRRHDVERKVIALRSGAKWDGARTINHAGRVLHAERASDGAVLFTVDGVAMQPAAIVELLGQ